MEPFVDEGLGDVERRRALLLLPRRGEHELMHARPVERDVVRVPQLREEIVGREDRVVRCLGEPFLAERAHIRVCADEHAEVAEERPHATDRIAESGRRLVVPRRVEVIAALLVANDPRLWQERPKRLLHAERTRAGPAGTMRGREGLVHVDVDAVEAKVTGTRDAEKRVHVRAVAVHETADGVDRIAHLAQTLLEETERVRVRQHQTNDVVAERGLERCEVDVPVRVALDGRDLEPAHRGRCRVRAVRGVRHDHPVALRALTALLVIGLEHQDRGELRLRARGGLQGDRVHSGELGEHPLELREERQRSLDRALRLLRMQVREERRNPIVDLRVVLHGAGAEWVHARVDGVVELGEVREMTNHLRLAELR